MQLSSARRVHASDRGIQLTIQAERLGVLVPGVPGYVRAADRARIDTWARPDGTLITPDWWDVERDDEKGTEEPRQVTQNDPSLGYAAFVSRFSHNLLAVADSSNHLE